MKQNIEKGTIFIIPTIVTQTPTDAAESNDLNVTSWVANVGII